MMRAKESFLGKIDALFCGLGLVVFGLILALVVQWGGESRKAYGLADAPAARASVQESPSDIASALGGGDTCATAVVFEDLPFSDTGNTCSFTDDYDETCPYDKPGSADVVYAFTPADDIAVDISLCANSAYDTKLYVYENVCPAASFHACSDDSCSTPSHPEPFVSDLERVILSGQNTYYIVVDGWGGDCGSYTLDVTEAVLPVPDIRVDSPSLTFSCQGGAGESMATPDLAVAPPSLTERTIDEKLVDADTITQAFESGQDQVDVIVSLSRPWQVLANTRFGDPASMAVLQAEVAGRQEAVLSTLTIDEFEIENRYENMAAFSGMITRSGLAKLLKDPRVDVIEPVRILEAHLAEGIPLINGMAYRTIYYGQGVAIAICDTGIDYTHPRLGGGGFPNSKVIGGYDFGATPDDDNPMPVGVAHGTCCAGIAAGNLGTVGDYIGGVAPAAKLYALKISPDNSGSASTSDMVAAWDWCVTHQNDDPNNPIMVISTSFGGGRYFAACDGAVPAMTTAAGNAAAAGITILASSGNDGWCESMGWPACISDVVSVGAVYDEAFGNHAPCVNQDSCATKYASGGCSTGWFAIDVSAPDLVTSYSNSATFLDLLAPSNRAYTTDIAGSSGYSSGDYVSSFGGTSAACPYAAGAVASLQHAARVLRGSYLTPGQVRAVLASSGDLITDPKVPSILKPRVNLAKAISYVMPCNGQTLAIHNDGELLLTVNSVDSPAWVSLSPQPPYIIAPGATMSVCVQADCDACAWEDLDGALQINSNDPDEPAVSVNVHVDCPGCPTPTTTAWRSVKEHTNIGDLGIALDPSVSSGSGKATTEPRIGGITRIEVDFDMDVSSCYTPGEVIALRGTTVVPATDQLINDNRTLEILLPASPDAPCWFISINNSIEGIINDADCYVGMLEGDTNGDQRVDSLDRGQVKVSELAQDPATLYPRRDVNLDGRIDALDRGAVKVRELALHEVTCP